MIPEYEIALRKVCPVCMQEYMAKRTSQVYCNKNDFECRTYNNNKIAKQNREGKNKIDKFLDKNRKVLKMALGSKNEIIKSHEWLIGAGFNFGYLTHKSTTDGTLFTYIYDFKLKELGNKTYHIKNGTNN